MSRRRDDPSMDVTTEFDPHSPTGERLPARPDLGPLAPRRVTCFSCGGDITGRVDGANQPCGHCAPQVRIL